MKRNIIIVFAENKQKRKGTKIIFKVILNLVQVDEVLRVKNNAKKGQTSEEKSTDKKELRKINII